MNAALRSYDFRDALKQYAGGAILTREIEDALHAAYAANGFTPVTEAQVLAIVTPPALPSGLVRLRDSNPAPDGWAIDNPGAQ